MASTTVNAITQDIIHLLFGNRVGLSLAWILTSRLGWLVTEPQVSTFPPLRSWIINVHLQACFFRCALRGSTEVLTFQGKHFVNHKPFLFSVFVEVGICGDEEVRSL